MILINNTLTELPVSNCPDFSTTTNTNAGEATFTFTPPNYGPADVTTDGAYFYHGGGTQPSVVFATVNPPGLPGPPFQLPGGTNVISTTISDAELSFTCSSSIEVIEVPCQRNTAYTEPSQNVTVDYVYNPASLVDPYNYTNIVADPPTNSSFPVGTTTVTVTYEDPLVPASNQMCTFDVIVTEITSPTCPDDVMVDSGLGQTSISATWPPATAPYTADIPIQYDQVNGSLFSLGNTTVTAYPTGYQHINCTFIVRVAEDSSPPVFTNNFTGTVLPFNNSQTPSWILTASDNSGIVTITSSPSPGSYFPLGDTMVTVTATDGAMLTTTQTFTVRVVSDGSPETRNCPTDITRMVNPDQVPVTVTWTPPTANGTGDITTTNTSYPGALFNAGTTKVTYTFTDADGRSSKCFFKIRITLNADMEAPRAVCPGNITRTVPAGTMRTRVEWTEPVFNDVVSGNDLQIQQSKMSGSYFPEGTTAVLYLAMDGNFNEVRCTFYVTVNVVEDNTPPSIVGCPGSFTQWVSAGSVANGMTPVTVSWIVPNITDDSNFTTSVSHLPGSVFPVGVDTVVSYNATDIVNNMANCTFTVSVREDTVDPVLECLDNITMFVTVDVVNQVVTWPTPNATDNSGAVTVTTNPPSGTAFGASVSGQNDMVIVTAADNYGNDVMCTFYVNIRHDLTPVLTCPNVTQETSPGQPTASNIMWPDVTIVDDYTSVSALMNTSTPASMISSLRFDEPAIEVTLTATDERGNIGTCQFWVNVVDMEAPVWSNCPNNITQDADVGTNTRVVSWTAPTVTDNSGIDPPVKLIPPSSQTFSGGVHPVVYSATDGSGNTGTCQFFVTIQVDDDVPVFSNCPTSQVRVTATAGSDSAVVDWGQITATDNSGQPTVTSNFQTGQTFTIGSYDVEYRALDVNGNIAYCRFNVIVLDGEAPGFVSCPTSFEVFVLSSQSSVIVTWETPRFVDNSVQGEISAILASGSTRPGSRLSPGSYNIAYEAMDASGNTASTCSFTVTVTAITDTIQLPGELTLDVVRGINGLFNPSISRLNDLRNDLDDLFRVSSSLASDFVGIDIIGNPFDDDDNLQVQFTLHLRNPSYYNEEEIKEAFYAALTNNLNFAPTNTIVPGSFNLHVTEFRGQLTLMFITAQAQAATPPQEVSFSSCCSDPTSSAYQNLEQEVNRNLWNTFNANTNTNNNLNNFRTVKALRFRSGSVVVPFTVTLGESTTATPTQAANTFAANVGNNNEWRPGSGLFLASNTLDSIAEVCPASMCMNGGTCTVLNATHIYEDQCSCPAGTSGDNCENTGPAINLSTAAIIGIVVGVVAFLLLLLVICCCCFFLLSRPRGYRRDAEYGTKAAPLMLMPRDEYIYRHPPIMDRPGPVITEIEEAHEGPYFMHESVDYNRPPAPLPLAIEPPPPPVQQPPRPVTLGPQFLHEYAGHLPSPRRNRSQRNRFREMLPARLPRAHRRDNLGPQFQGDSERVEDMKRRLFREFNY